RPPHLRPGRAVRPGAPPTAWRGAAHPPPGCEWFPQRTRPAGPARPGSGRRLYGRAAAIPQTRCSRPPYPPASFSRQSPVGPHHASRITRYTYAFSCAYCTARRLRFAPDLWCTSDIVFDHVNNCRLKGDSLRLNPTHKVRIGHHRPIDCGPLDIDSSVVISSELMVTHDTTKLGLAFAI